MALRVLRNKESIYTGSFFLLNPVKDGFLIDPFRGKPTVAI